MTLKTLLGGSISVLVLGLFTMPAMAANKTTYKAIAKTGKIECEVTVDDGKTIIKKTINGKTVKTDENDKDCDVRLQVAHQLGAVLGMDVERFSGGNKKIRMIMMDGAKNSQQMSKIGDRIIFSGGKSPFLSKIGDVAKIKMIISDDGNFVDSDAMRWFSNSGSGMNFGQVSGMGHDLQLMFIDDDNKELDLDKDGTVTEAEARKARNAKLKSYDSNRDGMLSLDEYQAYWLSKRHAKMVDNFQDLDEDGDARITGAEFSSSAVKSARVREKMQKMMAEHKTKLAPKHKKKRK